VRFILGVLIGGAIGAALGLIIAPQSGRETREALGRRVRTAADEARQQAQEAEPVSTP
jgi:gas vesicle protein